MGIGHEALRAVKPDLVYVSISGFGSSGPYAQRGVYDPLIQAASGMASAQGRLRDDPGQPTPVRSIVCDKATGLMAAQAITAALFARERGSGGQHLQLAMLDAAIAFHWSDMMWRHTFLEDGVTLTPELAEDPQVAHNQILYEFDHPSGGRRTDYYWQNHNGDPSCRAPASLWYRSSFSLAPSSSAVPI